jgi:hypothetical protein
MDETPTPTDTHDLLAAEDAYVAAEIASDEAALRELLDDRFVINGSDGTTSGKEALIAAIVGWSMTGQTISERSAVIVGDTGVICGTTELRFAAEGGEVASRHRYTSTYIRREGRWRMLALQMVPRALEG